MSEEKYKVDFDPMKYKPCKTIQDVLDLLKTNPDIRFVRIFFTDLLGNMECDFTVPSYEVTEESLKRGFGYDGSSVLGQSRIQESDKLAVPIVESARVTPWIYTPKTAGIEDQTWRELIMFAKLYNPDGQRYEGDVRYVLERGLANAKKLMGADHVYVGPELEFFLFQANGMGRPLLENGVPLITDHGDYFKGGRYGVVRKESQLLLQAMGYKFEYDHHEVAPSQHETDFRYTDALEMADFIILYKYVLRRVARLHGLFATFMPKPLRGVNGSGMHIHMSLFKGNKNLFFDSKDPFGMSIASKQFMAGIMKHAPEVTSVLNQWVNSYKRLVPGYEAPVYICWDPENRSNLVRVPIYEPGKENAVRLELRSPDPACNPYLAFAVMLHAGLKGVSEKYKIPEPVHENVYEMDETEREKKGIKSLPGNLKEAIQTTEQGTLVREAFRNHLYRSFIENKKREWDDYINKTKHEDQTENPIVVTRYELEEFLPVL